jgi:hypothetical protein
MFMKDMEQLSLIFNTDTATLFTIDLCNNAFGYH